MAWVAEDGGGWHKMKWTGKCDDSFCGRESPAFVQPKIRRKIQSKKMEKLWKVLRLHQCAGIFYLRISATFSAINNP